MVQNIPGILAIWIKWASTKSYSGAFIQQRTSWSAKNIVLTLFQVWLAHLIHIAKISGIFLLDIWLYHYKAVLLIDAFCGELFTADWGYLPKRAKMQRLDIAFVLSPVDNTVKLPVIWYTIMPILLFCWNYKNGAKWPSWRLKPAENWTFVKQIIRAKENFDAPFVRRIKQWLLDSFTKGPMMRKAFPYYDVLTGSYFVCAILEQNWPSYHADTVNKCSIICYKQDVEHCVINSSSVPKCVIAGNDHVGTLCPTKCSVD